MVIEKLMLWDYLVMVIAKTYIPSLAQFTLYSIIPFVRIFLMNKSICRKFTSIIFEEKKIRIFFSSEKT